MINVIKVLFVRAGVSIALLAGLLSGAHAAVVQQSVTLKGGWNAVFLEVEPADPDPAVVFAGVPDLLSVWAWNPRTSPVEYIDNPDELLPEFPYMLAWFPGQPEITNLHAIRGELAYLVHREGAATDHTWNVSGEPEIPHIDWVPDSFNLVGFHLAAGQEPLFADFFSASAAHEGQEIYILDNATGNWVEVTSPSVQMKKGEAFWIYCKGGSQFTGSLAVQLEQSTGLHFGTVLTEQRVLLRNHAGAGIEVSASVSSADVQLQYWVFNPEDGTAEWRDFSSQPPTSFEIPAGDFTEHRLGTLRAGIPEGAVRSANLRVGGGGMSILVPVSVTGIGYEGLWVGNATIRKVSQPQGDDPLTPVRTGSELSYRLIVHLDDGGQARLLREVVQLWQESTSNYVLVANAGRLDEFTPAALRDGQPVGRRISSAAFGFPGAVAMSGAFDLNQTLAASVTVQSGDSTNPFRHLYHPDHKLTSQSFRIDRDVALEFSDHDGDGNTISGAPVLGWGSSDVGGIYRETISLKRDDPGDVPYAVHIEGTFLLHKVSGIPELQL